MKKNFFASIVAVSVVIMGFMSCVKNTDTGTTGGCTNTNPILDSTALLGFATANGVGPLKDTDGLYYQIITQGTGAVPSANSVVYVTFTGELMNGTIFDSTTNSASTGFVLDLLIPGWQLGLPLIQAGGHIRLLVPSDYGYGCQGSGTTVPANAPLYFDITLVSVQ
jgi:FKBP-type peptidyl-prolyl cis-trans isomerase FkpA